MPQRKTVNNVNSNFYLFLKKFWFNKNLFLCAERLYLGINVYSTSATTIIEKISQIKLIWDILVSVYEFFLLFFSVYFPFTFGVKQKKILSRNYNRYFSAEKLLNWAICSYPSHPYMLLLRGIEADFALPLPPGACVKEE